MALVVVPAAVVAADTTVVVGGRDEWAVLAPHPVAANETATTITATSPRSPLSRIAELLMPARTARCSPAGLS